MADRYWVGGTATWDSTAGTKWATTSGGTGGASAPTTADNVFIDGNSGTGTITVGVGQSGNVIDFTGFTGTLDLSNAFNTRGLTFSTGMTITGTSLVSVTSPASTTVSLNTNGKTIPGQLSISTESPSPGTVQLASNVVVSGRLDLGASLINFKLNGYNIDCDNLLIGPASSLEFGSNKINITGNNKTVLSQTHNVVSVTYSGSGGIYSIYSGSSGTRTFSAGTTGTILTNGSAPLYINNGSDRIDFSSSTFAYGVNFTGFTGTIGLVSATGTKTFGCAWNTSVFVNTCTLEPTSTVLYSLIGTITGSVPPSQYWQLGAFLQSVTLSGNFTNTFNGTYNAIADSATVNLTGFALTLDNLVMATSGLRLNGPGTVNITGNNKTVLEIKSSPQIQFSPVINLTYAGSVGTRTINNTPIDLYNLLPTGATVNISSGSDTVNFGATESYLQNLDFTGFSGTMSGSVSVSGNLTLSSTTNYASGSTITYRSSSNSVSGTYGLATVGGSCKCPDNLILAWTTASTVITGASTLNLLNDVTLTDNASFSAQFILRAGILALNGYNLSVPSFTFSHTNNTYKRINFGLTGNKKIILNSKGISSSLTYSTFSTYIDFVSATSNSNNLFEISGSSGQTRTIRLYTSINEFNGATDSKAIKLSAVSTSDAIQIETGKYSALTTDNTFSGSIFFNTAAGDPFITGPISFGTTGSITGSAGGTTYFRAMSGCTLSSGITLQCGINITNFGAIYPATLTLNSNVTVAILNTAQFDLTISNAQNSGSAANLDLGSYTLNIGSLTFTGSGTAGKGINFNTGTLNITGNNRTVLQSSATAPIYTGTTKQFNLTYSGSTGTRALSHTYSAYGGANLRVSAGSDIINIAANAEFEQINFVGFTGSVTGGAVPFQAYSSITLGAGMTLGNSSITMLANTSQTSTFTRNGATITSNVTFSGPGTGSLGDSFVSSGSFIIGGVAGHTFNSNNNPITARAISSNSANARTINLGTSIITINAVAATSPTVVNLNATGLTFNGSNAPITINLDNAPTSTLTFQGAGQTFNNLTISSGTNDYFAFNISGANTFANLTLPTRNSVGGAVIGFNNSQAITGNLDFNGSATINKRTSVAIGPTNTDTAVTLTAATVSNLSNIDFSGVTASGASSPWSGTNLGDAKNNTNITFGAGSDKYYVSAGSGNYTDNAWALSSGGSVSSGNYPLPQDTVYIDDNSGSASSTLTINNSSFLPNITTANRTLALTLSPSGTILFSGNLTLSSPITINFGGAIFGGVGTFTPNAATISGNISINYNGSLTAGDDINMSASTLTVTNGSLTFNNKTITVSNLTGGSVCRLLAFGSSGVLNAVTFNNSAAGAVFSATGSKTLNLTGTGAKTYQAVADTSAFSAQSVGLNLNSVATTGTLALSGCVDRLNLAGFTGTANMAATVGVFGDVTFVATAGSFSGTGTLRFRSTGTQTVTSNNKTWTTPIRVSGVGGTVRLLDNFTSTNTLTIEDGTFDVNDFTAGFTVLNIATSGSPTTGTKVIDIGTGIINLSSSAATVINISATYAAYVSALSPSTGQIRLNGTGTKTVSANGANLSGINLVNNNASGSVAITTNATFSKLSNSFSPATFTFTSGITVTLTDTLNINGTVGNLVTLTSSINGSKYTLSSSVPSQSVTYTSIRDSDAVGGSTWDAFTTNGNIDAGNNTGWNFSASGNTFVNAVGVQATGEVSPIILPDENVTVTGVSALGQVGILPGVDINVSVNGVQAFCVTFPVQVDIPTVVNVTGVGANGVVNGVFVFTDCVFDATGLQALGEVSNVNIFIIENITVTITDGVVGIGEVGQEFFFDWAPVNTFSDPNWVPINDTHASNWATINTNNSTVWSNIIA